MSQDFSWSAPAMLLTSSPSSWSQLQERRNNAPLGTSVLTWQATQGSGGTWHWDTHPSPGWSRSRGGRAWAEGMFKIMLFTLPKIDLNFQASSSAWSSLTKAAVVVLQCSQPGAARIWHIFELLSVLLLLMFIYTTAQKGSSPETSPIPWLPMDTKQTSAIPIGSRQWEKQRDWIQLQKKKASTGVIRLKLCAQ